MYRLNDVGTPVKDDLGFTESYLWYILKDGLTSKYAGEGLTLGAARRDALNKIRELNAQDELKGAKK